MCENFREFRGFRANRGSFNLAAKTFIEYGDVIINGRVVVVSLNSRKFNRENLTFNNARKFSPAKDSHYTVRAT